MRFTIAPAASTRRRSLTRLAPAWRCSTSTRDGWLDVYLVNGVDGRGPEGSRAGAARGTSSATTTTALSPMPLRRQAWRTTRWGFGAAACRLRQRRLARPVRGELRQESPGPTTTHDGTFSDVAEGEPASRLGGWSTCPSWGDYNRDGLLDLSWPGYVSYRCGPSAGKPGRPACYRRRASFTA